MKKIGVKSRLAVFEKVSTIKAKLMASFMIAIALILILGAASYQKAATAIRKNYMASTSQTLNMTGEYLAFGFNSIQDTATQMINDSNIISYFSNMYGSDNIKINNAKQSISKLLSSKSVTDDFIGNIYLLSDKAESMSTKKISFSGIYADFKETALGTRLQQNKMDVIWSGRDAYLDDRLGTGASDYSVRLIRNIASVDGLLIIDISSKTIEAILKNIEFEKSGMLGIVTADGKEITGSGDKEAVFFDKAFYQEARESGEKSGSNYVDYHNERYLFMYTKIADTGAMICALVSEGTISEQAADIRLFSMVIVILACIIAVFNGVTITSSINKAIKGMITVLKKASVGDLTVVFPSKRKDEFQILINEIQNTLSNMKALIFGVKSLSNEVMASSARVGETTASFQRATENISDAMSEVEQGIVQQAKDAEGCLTEMENLSRKLILISDNTKEISRITEQTRESIQEGTQCTKKLNEQTQTTIQITTDIVRRVEQQAEKSLSINQISNVISDIANHINLLSLNASIEAARAGEFGRGFAVIANEIRSLADQSKRSVNEIKTIIGNIQGDAKDTMEIVRKAEGVLQLQENAVTETTCSYSSINHNVEELVVNLNYITDTIENIEESRVSTLGAVESISAVLEEIAASSNTVNQASKEQLASVDSLGGSSEVLSENAGKLLHAVDKFTV